MTLLTISEYAKREGVSRQTVWNWIAKGAVVVVRKAPRTGVRVIDDRASQIPSNPSNNPLPQYPKSA